MKKSLFSISAATLLAFTSIPAKAQDDGLVYVAVDPCRVANTRDGRGVISAGESRNFLVSGTSGQLAAQGGAVNCPNPRAGSEPLAVSAYVLAVKTTTSGNGKLSVYPSDQSQPPAGSGTTVTFAAQQNIGNTTTITLCDPTGACPSDGEFAVLARSSEQDVIIDIQGYYYPASGIDKYEASLVDASGAPTTAAACNVDGSDCGGVIFAQSVSGVTPAASITWYQAAQACANVGKRLPTTAEWQMAAAGTPEGTGTDCNALTGAITTTGAGAGCFSTTGAFDMVGNLWEWTAELESQSTGITTTNSTYARALGASWANDGGQATTRAMTVEAGGPLETSSRIGFRCAR